MTPDRPHVIETPAELEALLGSVVEASIRKESPTLHPHCPAMIQASPFAVLATSGPGGLEALTAAAIDGATYDRDLPERQRTTLH